MYIILLHHPMFLYEIIQNQHRRFIDLPSQRIPTPYEVIKVSASARQAFSSPVSLISGSKAHPQRLPVRETPRAQRPGP